MVLTRKMVLHSWTSDTASTQPELTRCIGMVLVSVINCTAVHERPDVVEAAQGCTELTL
eukprot:gene52321-58478_t